MKKKTITVALGLVMILLCCSVCACGGDVAINEKNFPDPEFRESIMEIGDEDSDGKLSPSEIEGITELYYDNTISHVDGNEVKNLNICSFKGIEYLTALEIFHCSGLELESLDVSKNIALIELSCSDCPLKSLDVSNNTELIALDCSIQYTENQLANYGITSLDVSNNTKLEYLNCNSNQLTALDVSNNMELDNLDCSGNKLTNLDVSRNAALYNLVCEGNELAELNVSQNTKLKYLECGVNKLTELDVSNNTELEQLVCAGNKLTELDVSNNTALYELACDERTEVIGQNEELEIIRL